MNIIQSFYQVDNKTCYKINKINDNYLINYYSLLLSYITLKKLYGNVTMYCNQYAYDKILKHIPYDNIIINDLLNITTSNYYNDWALLKFEVYKLQKEPFIHVDGDVFIFRDLLSEFINGEYDAVVQSVETSPIYSKFYYANLDKLVTYNFIDLEISTKTADKYDGNIIGYNCGVVGFKNMDFLKYYTKKAQEMNMLINNKTIDSVIHAPMIYEQFVLHELLIKNNMKCHEVLPSEDVLGKGYNAAGNIHGYTHLLSGNKYVQHFVMLIREKILKDYPEYINYLNDFEETIADADIEFLGHSKINSYF